MKHIWAYLGVIAFLIILGGMFYLVTLEIQNGKKIDGISEILDNADITQESN